MQELFRYIDNVVSTTLLEEEDKAIELTNLIFNQGYDRDVSLSMFFHLIEVWDALPESPIEVPIEFDEQDINVEEMQEKGDIFFSCIQDIHSTVRSQEIETTLFEMIEEEQDQRIQITYVLVLLTSGVLPYTGEQVISIELTEEQQKQLSDFSNRISHAYQRYVIEALEDSSEEDEDRNIYLGFFTTHIAKMLLQFKDDISMFQLALENFIEVLDSQHMKEIQNLTVRLMSGNSGFEQMEEDVYNRTLNPSTFGFGNIPDPDVKN